MKLSAILILAAHLLKESWVLFGSRGNELITFIDGKTHGVSLWWFMTGLADQLLYCVYCFAGGMFARKYAWFFFLLLAYHLVNLAVWSYDYSTNRYVFYVMMVVLFSFTVRIFWPTRVLKIV